MIIDDERHMRNLLRLAIQWKELGVDRLLEARDGAEGLKLIMDERPEIIITDMRMPVKDGVFLLQEISQLSYPHRVIVVSGYDDFQYLKKTIEYGGFDYFIKPIDEEQLQERLKAAIAEIRRAVDEQDRHRETAIQLNEQKMTIRSEKLTYWLQHPDSFAQIRSWFQEEFGWPQGQAYYLAQIHMVERSERIIRLFDKRLDLLYFSILNIADEILEFPRNGAAFRDLSTGGSVCLLIRASDQYDAESICAKIVSAIHRAYRISAEIWMSPVQCFPDGVDQTKSVLQEIALHRNLLSPSPNSVYTARHITASEVISLLDEENDLKRILVAAHRHEIANTVTQMIGKCKDAGFIQLRQITWWEQELEWLKLNVLSDFIQDPMHKIARHFGNLRYWDDQGKFSLAELEQSLLDHLMMLADKVDMNRERSQKSDLHRVREYLRSNFHKPILIQDLAEMFYMNPEHLARQFKQEFQVGIKEFMTQLKMEQAKRLLANRNLRIHEISDMVGFSDEKYFSRVFKKETSLTPQQFRHNMID